MRQYTRVRPSQTSRHSDVGTDIRARLQPMGVTVSSLACPVLRPSAYPVGSDFAFRVLVFALGDLQLCDASLS